MPDSGGAGRWRGGLATAMDFRVSAPNSRVTARNRDRSHFRPWGILGGGPGAPSGPVLNPGTAKERVLWNTDTLTMEPGDVLHIHSPGGGGRGDPLEREPERVALDVARGYVSAEAASREYGVVLTGDGTPDPAATDAARAERRRFGTAPHFAFGPERDAYEAVWTADIYRDLTAILAAMPVHWRFFVKSKLFYLLPGAASLPKDGTGRLVARLSHGRHPDRQRHAAARGGQCARCAAVRDMRRILSPGRRYALS